MKITAAGAAAAAELIAAETDLADAIADRFGVPMAIVLETEADAEALVRDLGGELADMIRRVQRLRAAFREHLQ